MRAMKGVTIFGVAVLAVSVAAMGATPPERINYQGVLRDSANAPESGAFDMVFRFYDSDGGAPPCPGAGGVLLLTDSHLAAGMGGVTVTGGLFSVALGGGAITAGSKATLGEVFRDHDPVFIEVEVAGETLCPRVRILSSAYALNASRLNGVEASGYLDTSATSQTKAGHLAVADLTVNGDDLFFGSGSRLASGSSNLLVQAGTDDADDLFLQGGNNSSDGRIVISGGGPIELRSGDGTFTFVNGADPTETASLDALGNLQVDGDISVDGNDVFFPGGATIRGFDFQDGLLIAAGDTSTDDLLLRAGASFSSGFAELAIYGTSRMDFRASNGLYLFRNSIGNSAAQLNEGNLQLNGDLTVDGGNVTLADPTSINVSGSAATLTFGGTNLSLSLGDSGADQVLVPGSLSVSGTKNFVQNHPYRQELSILYTALEGDESGTYTRGSGRLERGLARVPLGETFAWVTNPDIGLTANVTPRGEWADLYVESVSTRELVVRSRTGSAAEAAFDYVVYGLRIGYEEFPVVQAKTMDSAVPAEGAYGGLYEAQPGLRAYTALERFRRMRADVRDGAGVEDSTASRALRRATGERASLDVPLESSGPVARGREEVGFDAGGEGERRIAAGGAASPGRPEAASTDVGRAASVVGSGPIGGTARAGASIPVDEEGNVYARSFRTGSSELASLVRVAEEVTAGDVLVIDTARSGLMSLARDAEERTVVGVVAAAPGVVLGAAFPRAAEAALADAPHARQRAGAAMEVPVALSGVALCKVDASYGAIRPGDLLTTSRTPGHAKRSVDPRPGAILGKALEPLEEGRGLIRVLVTLR